MATQQIKTIGNFVDQFNRERLDHLNAIRDEISYLRNFSPPTRKCRSSKKINETYEVCEYGFPTWLDPSALIDFYLPSSSEYPKFDMFLAAEASRMYAMYGECSPSRLR